MNSKKAGFGCFQFFFEDIFVHIDLLVIFATLKTVAIAQLVRVSDCDSEGRGFEPHWLPKFPPQLRGIFYL